MGKRKGYSNSCEILKPVVKMGLDIVSKAGGAIGAGIGAAKWQPQMGVQIGMTAQGIAEQLKNVIKKFEAVYIFIDNEMQEVIIIEPINTIIEHFKTTDEFNIYYTMNKEEMEEMITSIKQVIHNRWIQNNQIRNERYKRKKG